MSNRHFGNPSHLKRILALAFVLCASAPLIAQAPSSTPNVTDISHPTAIATSENQSAQATVQGRVLDATGAIVVGARVSLGSPGSTISVSSATGTDGGFSLPASQPGQYTLTIAAQGFSEYSSSLELTAPSQTHLGDITLVLAPVAVVVQVQADRGEIAAQQVRDEEHQRLLGVVPNYYVSYNQVTAPLSSKQKFSLAGRFTVDPVSFGIVGIIAGVEQANNDFSGYGPGAAGYGKRYAAAYGDFLTSIIISNAILPSVFKQDPRYFYQGTGSKRSRISHALASAVVCKGDSGRWQANYSNILGNLASGAISNAYYPAADRNGAALTFEGAAANIASTALSNLLQEFLFKKVTPHVAKIRR